MKRVLACTIVTLALAACTQEARPQGIVENWLRSLNQGAAGRPDRYAPDSASQQVLPGWHDLAPGQLDTIETGAATATDAGQNVPFRTVDIDGAETIGVAHLVADGDSWKIASVEGAAAAALAGPASAPDRLPPGWPFAVLIALMLSLAGVGLLTLVRRSAERAS